MIDCLLQLLKEQSLTMNVHIELVEQHEPERASVPESGKADADEEVTDIECATELVAV
jgi:hypothetical protein